MQEMILAYITAQAPYGRGESFIIEEMLALRKLGIDLVIVPRNPPKEVFHTDAEKLLGNTVWLPLFSIQMIPPLLKTMILKPHFWIIIFNILFNSRNLEILIKNLSVVPKAVFISHLFCQMGIQHIHAHWGSTTATMAYIISQLTGISWSFTLHRWDIRENNMLKEKVNTAKFVRCISENGRNELLNTISRKYGNKVKVIHMGVKTPDKISEPNINRDFFTIVTPANLLEVKGHKFLAEACSILIERGIDSFQCIFYGEGPLRTELEKLIQEKGLTEYIKIPGAIPHQELLKIYKNHKVDIVVLPSITTADGEHEGIPVALMEAMAYGIPVISTNTGGIPELIGDGSGIMVKEKSAEDIADRLEMLIKDRDYRYEISRKGRLKVEKEFDIEKNVRDLIELTLDSLCII